MDLREAAATKDGLPRRAFAYAPSPDPATWSLPYLTARGEPDPDHLPGSAAAVSEAGIPVEAMPTVRSKLRQAYRRWKGSDVTYPASLQEDAYGTATPDPMGAGLGCSCGHPYECGCTECSCKMHVDPSVTDVTTGLSVLMQLYQLKAGEIGQPSQMSLIDAAIVALTSWVNLEGSEIGMAGIVEAADFGWIEELGARNSRTDQAMVQSMHDFAIKLGATCDASMAEAAPVAEPPSAPVPAVRVEIGSGAKEEISFFESSTDQEFVPLSEASPIFDDEKKEITIRPVKAGWGNKRDKRYYTRESLREAIEDGVFTRRKMFADHPTKDEAKLRPERSVRDWVSTIREAWWDEKADEPRARIKVYDQKFWDLAKEAPDEVAFSIRGGGYGRKGKVDGQDAFIVESIGKINSVDWVTEAGAGGAIAFAESAAEEFEMDVKDLTPEQLKDANPELFAAIQKTALIEGEGDAPAEGDDAPAAKPAEIPAREGDPAVIPDPSMVPAPTETPVQESSVGTALLARLEALEKKDADRSKGDRHEAALREAATVVEDKIKASTLPTKAKDAVKIRFAEAAVEDGGYISTEALGRAIDSEISLAEQLVASFRGPVGATSLKAADEGAGKTPVQLVESRIGDKWGTEQLPTKETYVYANGKDEKRVEAPEAQIVESTAGQSVQERLAARMNLN